MKNKHLFLRGKTYALLLATGTLLWGSCAIGYDSPNGFDSGVHNTQMTPPKAESITFTTNTSITEATIGWPLQNGAGGYEVTFTNVDDPDNPVIVNGIENMIVDGNSMTVPVAEDCNYTLKIRTLGNKELNNTDAEEANIIPLSTLVPSIVTVPDGADIYTYLQENPLPEVDMIGTQAAIDLVPGGNYTCSGPVDFGGYYLTLRGGKINSATVTMTNDAAFYTYGGLALKYLKFDCAQSTAKSLIFFSENAPGTILTENIGGYTRNGGTIKGIYMVKEPIYVSGCWVKDLPNSFLHGSEKACAFWYLTIDNCIIQQKCKNSTPFINLEKNSRSIKHISLTYSTIFNTEDANHYWIRYGNESNAQPDKVFGNATSEYSTTTTDVIFCTLSKCYSKSKMANNYRRSVTYTTISHSIFYDCSSVRQFAAVGTKNFSWNFWYATTNQDKEDPGQKDNNGNVFAAEYDPQFTGSVTQSLDLTQPNGGVNFIPQNREVIINRGGDPRWLPAQ